MTHLNINQILYTKDGREIGNAIVHEIHQSGNVTIITDYGNHVRLTEDDLDSLFYWKKEGLTKEDIDLIETTHKHAVK